MLNLICLLDLDADPYGIDGRFNEDFLGIIPADGQGVQQDLRRRSSLDLGDIVSF
jgi:hypothetical protein